MSYLIETLNRGTIEDFGYLGPDITKVRLGELPPLKFDDFCQYATNTLVVALETASVDEKRKISQLIDRSITEIESVPTRDKPLTSFREETIDAFKKSLVNMSDNHELRRRFELIIEGLEKSDDEAETFLETNPFSLQGTTVTVGENYQLSLLEFAHFTIYIARGGWFGWDERGAPESAREGFHKIQESLKVLVAA